MKCVSWETVDLLKDKHRYAHFFLNAELLRNFATADRTPAEKISYADFMLQYYTKLQSDYADALELCLSSEVLLQYTLPERFVMLCNLKPHFTQYILQSMYAIAPIMRGKFDTEKLIQFNDLAEVDTIYQKRAARYTSGQCAGGELVAVFLGSELGCTWSWSRWSSATSTSSAAGCVTAILFWSISASAIIANGFIRTAAPASSLAQS